jgi:Tfp pilus assembly protein FimT
MAAPAERMKAMRQRRRIQGYRELRMLLPDARSAAVRQRIARQVAALDRAAEHDALGWIEVVSEFDDAGPAATP